ncbi:MAG TPA: two-component regulator propeller domain-containing protein [Prolixibacteraceae bacterium]|nr:two-component regulator propeller domain-containing protein [Prolixibacteraceae bacterium]
MKRLICACIILLLSLNAKAQERVKFHHYTTKDGMSFNSVRCLYQDSKGFIWIGTDGGGLNRFDGYHFTVYKYNEDNPQSISNNQINSIIEDHLGYLWVATGNGLNRFDTNTSQFKRFYHEPENSTSLRHNTISTLYEDSENTLWVGTSMGLHKYLAKKGEFVSYYKQMTIHDPRPDKEITSIVEDPQGNLWIGTWWGGLKKFNKKTEKFTDFYSHSKDRNGIHNNNVTSLYLDDKGILWTGNYLGGIRRLNIHTEKYLPVIDPENNAIVLGICKDNRGRIWYSRTGLGICQPDIQSFKLLNYDKSNPYGINAGNYFSILCDRTGIMWLGSDQGLSMYDAQREKFTAGYRSINNHHYKIETFYLNKEKNLLWVGTLRDGLIKYDENIHQAKQFLPGPSVSDPFTEIQTLCSNDKDKLWIGTNNGIGILNLKTEKIEDVVHHNPHKPTLANRMYGNNEFMWQINNSVRIFDLLRQKEYRFPTSGDSMLPRQRITNVMNENDSNLWIGTVEGLSRYHCKTHKIEHYFNQLGDSTSISNKYVLSIFKDSQGKIWIGTQNGLNRYNEKLNNFDRYIRNISFASNYILHIKEDKHHNLWLFTDKGITKFNPETGLVRNYDESDGLDLGGSVVSGKDGLFYCNRKTEDYLVFHPDSIKDNPMTPPVYITRFLLFNKEVPVSTETNKTPLKTNISETQEIILKHNQSYLGFEFVALNYTLPEKNQYAYRMEGFDNDWYYTDASHLSATYTNLNAGTYVFRVKASNNDGIWNEQGAQIKVVVLPPFWKTKWAYSIYFIIIAALIYFFRSYLLYQYDLKTQIEIERIKAEKTHEIDQMKLDFFGNISHELRTPLTLISGPLDHFLERKTAPDPKEDERYYAMMKRNVDRLLHLITKVLDIRKLDSGFLNVNLKNEDLVLFIQSLTTSFQFKAEQKSISFNTIFHQPNYNTWFDPDIIDKIVFNLLSNAFKFTSNHGEISIETTILEKESQKWRNETTTHDMKLTTDLVRIIVRDNGIGIPEGQREKVFERFYQADNQASRSGGSGIGLALVKELVGLVKGKIKLESEIGKGSCFTVWIPIGIQTAEVDRTLNDQALEAELLSQENYKSDVLTEAIPAVDPLESACDRALILIVEDNQDLVMFISDILKGDFDLLTANNGKTGLELAMEYIPDLIVSDIMMPDMNGLEMCQHIRNNERTNHVPLVLLTARSTEEHQVEGLFAGADDYIMKPFHPKNLQLRVSNIIKSRQLLREKFSLSDIEDNPSVTSSCHDAFVNKIRGIVEKHIDNPDFDPNLFAAETGMSRAQLYRKIKAITNQSVNDFIFSVRINCATKLLLAGELNISQVADAVGFKTSGHFSKMFIAHKGMPPSRYVELHKK